MFDHEKLDVYRCSVAFAGMAMKLLPQIPREQAPLADQLRRASSSVPLNIAEACGKPTAADRARFFATARGSAMECAAILDIARLYGANHENVEEGKRLLHRIVAMLSKLAL